MVVQWSTHALNLLRYINLSKFLGLKTIYTEEEAGAGKRAAGPAVVEVPGNVRCSCPMWWGSKKSKLQSKQGSFRPGSMFLQSLDEQWFQEIWLFWGKNTGFSPTKL